MKTEENHGAGQRDYMPFWEFYLFLPEKFHIPMSHHDALLDVFSELCPGQSKIHKR